MPLYLQSGLTLSQDGAGDPNAVRALQQDLRMLGYLRSGIDGAYGSGTAQAVRALQYDLLHNGGNGSDGSAPRAMTSFNRKADGSLYVAAVNGICDQNTAQALAAVAASADVGKLSKSANPAVDNQAAIATVMTTKTAVAPSSFIIAIMVQESGCRHFNVPGAGNADTYVTVGLDRNDTQNPDHITSRGYGLGQYTLFHHPPATQELAELCTPEKNVQQAFAELRDKFDHFVVGSSGADDRSAEHPGVPLRLCRYDSADARYFCDCKACAQAAPKLNIVAGTPFYPGASGTYQPTQYYQSASHPGTPNRAAFACDWPYAVRRYNGAGVNSYHYQCIVLHNLLS
jgi:peptidoglycan hydrolase-like protein with peptidoglycan-binding domain